MALKFEENDKVCGFKKGKVTDMSWYVDKENKFEILSEEDEEINIQSIEEIVTRPYKGFVDTCNYIEEKGNELLKAIKQLDKKIKEKTND